MEFAPVGLRPVVHLRGRCRLIQLGRKDSPHAKADERKRPHEATPNSLAGGSDGKAILRYLLLIVIRAVGWWCTARAANLT